MNISLSRNELKNFLNLQQDVESDFNGSICSILEKKDNVVVDDVEIKIADTYTNEISLDLDVTLKISHSKDVKFEVRHCFNAILTFDDGSLKDIQNALLEGKEFDVHLKLKKSYTSDVSFNLELELYPLSMDEEEVYYFCDDLYFDKYYQSISSDLILKITNTL